MTYLKAVEYRKNVGENNRRGVVDVQKPEEPRGSQQTQQHYRSAQPPAQIPHSADLTRTLGAEDDQ